MLLSEPRCDQTVPKLCWDNTDSRRWFPARKPWQEEGEKSSKTSFCLPVCLLFKSPAEEWTLWQWVLSELEKLDRESLLEKVHTRSACSLGWLSWLQSVLRCSSYWKTVLLSRSTASRKHGSVALLLGLADIHPAGSTGEATVSLAGPSSE